jgi:hypothetical protein
MSGHYIETETFTRTGQTINNNWYLTPCGDGCADVSRGGRAMLVNGQWTMDLTGTAVCGDGTKVQNANDVHYVWDPTTLAGTDRVTNRFAVCGYSKPESFTNTFQLRKAP